MYTCINSSIGCSNDMNSITYSTIILLVVVVMMRMMIVMMLIIVCNICNITSTKILNTYSSKSFNRVETNDNTNPQ